MARQLDGNASNPDGLTDSNDENLLNPTHAFTRRVDLIFVRNNGGDIGPVYAWTLGDQPWDRTLLPPRIWPSIMLGSLHG